VVRRRGESTIDGVDSLTEGRAEWE
jgi:hypothetical protein